MKTNPKDIEWLLHDLCVRLGFCMAARDPARFLALAHEGPHTFADAVLLAEGLDPNDPALDKSLWRGVHEFVAARFEQWAARDATDQPPDPSAGRDADMTRTQRRRFGGPFTPST